MSRIKAAISILGWWFALAILYAIETRNWPEARHWHMFDWHVWALGFINAMIIGTVVNVWKTLREGDE